MRAKYTRPRSSAPGTGGRWPRRGRRVRPRPDAVGPDDPAPITLSEISDSVSPTRVRTVVVGPQLPALQHREQREQREEDHDGDAARAARSRPPCTSSVPTMTTVFTIHAIAPHWANRAMVSMSLRDPRREHAPLALVVVGDAAASGCGRTHGVRRLAEHRLGGRHQADVGRRGSPRPSHR